MSTDQHTLDFLRWIADRNATYKEAWEVWQTTCPRHSTWEDSFIDGYVRPDRRDGETIVVLTALGRTVLNDSA